MDKSDMRPEEGAEKGKYGTAGGNNGASTPQSGNFNGAAGGFTFAYSAPTEEERREIESIRSQYLPSGSAESKLEQLRKLNKRVHSVPKAAAVALGIAGLLMFGGGLSLSLEQPFGWALAAGIAISVCGIAVMACAKPLYSALLKRAKKKYGDTVIKLTSELLGEEKDI